MKYVNSQRSYGFLITKELIFGFQVLDLKDHFSASLNCLLQFGCHDNHETLVIVFPICLTDCVKSFITSVSQIMEIWQIVSFLIMKYRNQTSRIQVFKCSPFFMLTLKKTMDFGFLSEIWTAELHIWRTAWRIRVIRISFFSIFKALWHF